MTATTFGQQALARFDHDSRRAEVLGELHARPFPLIELPKTLVVLAFMNEDHGARDHEVLTKMSVKRGVPPPARDARTHSFAFGHGRLRWERHTEFCTYCWEGPVPERFGEPVAGHPFGADFEAPGPLIAGVHLEIRPNDPAGQAALASFDRTSFCYSVMESGLAHAATDFRQDGDGLTRILVLDEGLPPARAGALAMRLVEIEIYRTLALLGLPLAHAVGPQVQALEGRLVQITEEMKGEPGDSRGLLKEITLAAAEVEASAASVLYRFGASRAYDEIVRERLAGVGEQALAGQESWSAFLKRRMAPAMRTCRAVEERQANLSEKLARAANLLRTRIDVELEHQNRDLLASMNRRAQLQLRLQQTVEGLSVAAIGYYVVGLFGYVAKGLEHEGLPVSATLLTAAFVPFALVLVWMVVERIRRHHGRPAGDDEH
ncbi:DUF3422 domain-containing protein [Jiella sp. MQZ9-1]|uniref:DUF3422 domain-containing protein n=1 Tax=Jiella flava TaxID=2816857 RepID=A0A939G180_9HYPH|nr:DUF3422 family protein [Jiella flava]MBO0663926.1 DUF3422 domain-containing protein [Jiella flava]MCD2472498.1 DUF3422 domain-containing protein [Jiella flava]